MEKLRQAFKVFVRPLYHSKIELKNDFESLFKQMFEETIASIDSRFRMQAAPWMGQDQQEEEDDAADEFGDEEEEEEESGKSTIQKRLWGATSFYDPVLLKQTGILVPGKRLSIRIKCMISVYTPLCLK